MKRIEKLLIKQHELDMHILETKNVSITSDELLANRVLAFNVELSETANEVRSFKHWSNKLPSANTIILEEFVDSLHFLLSLTLHASFNTNGDELSYVPRFKCVPMSATKNDINNSFIALFSASTEYYFALLERDTERAIEILADVWSIFSHLGSQLGFSDEDIDAAYERKNKINYERQKGNY